MNKCGEIDCFDCDKCCNKDYNQLDCACVRACGWEEVYDYCKCTYETCNFDHEGK